MLSVTAWILLVLSAATGATPPPLKVPVPSERLSGPDLPFPSRGVSIRLPAGDWKWYQYSGTETYFAERSPSEHAAYVFLLEPVEQSFEQRLSRSLKEARQYFKTSGYGTEVVERSRLEQPFRATYRVAMRATARGRPTVYEYIYLLPMGLQLQAASLEWPEPQWISTWARSCYSPNAHASP